jgi:two-component system copper resistance phosphate regulon response regulator CusR
LCQVRPWRGVAILGDAVRILVVEDETKVAKALREGLEAERYDVYVASTGEEGFFLVNHEAFDLIVLDLMLPRRDGIEVLRTLRKRGLQTPVLILTAKDAVDDRVHGLDSGADDYLVKPFAFPELLARIRALLRRDRPDQALKLRQDNLEMDVVTRKVRRAGQSVELTVKEFEILEYLLRHRGRVVSREMLARDVWHVSARATPLDNVIDVTIARLRGRGQGEGRIPDGRLATDGSVSHQGDRGTLPPYQRGSG